MKIKNAQGLSIRKKGGRGRKRKGRDLEKVDQRKPLRKTMCFLSCLLLSVPQFPCLQVEKNVSLAEILHGSYAPVHVSILGKHSHMMVHYSYLYHPLSIPAPTQNIIKNSPGLAHSISG